MRSISEFIQEQEAGYDYCNDNYVAAYCECAVATNLLGYYAEQAEIVSFAAENGITLFQEEGLMSKIGEGIKNVWSKFINFWKSIISKIKGFFTDKKVAHAREEVKKAADKNPDLVVTIDKRVLAPYALAATFDDMCDDLGPNFMTNKQAAQDNEVESAAKLINEMADEMKDKSIRSLIMLAGEEGDLPDDVIAEARKDGTTITTTAGMFYKILEDFNGNQLRNKLDRLVGRLNEIDKKVKNALASRTADINDELKWRDSGAYLGDENKKIVADKKKELTKIGRPSAKLSQSISRLTNKLTTWYEETISSWNTICGSISKLLAGAKAGDDVENMIGKPKEKSETESFYFV